MVPLGRLACEEWPNGIIGKWTVCDSHNVKTNHHRQTTACSTHNMAGVIARPFRAVLAFHWKTIRRYARAPQCTHQMIQCVCLQIHSKTICLKTGELSVQFDWWRIRRSDEESDWSLANSDIRKRRLDHLGRLQNSLRRWRNSRKQQLESSQHSVFHPKKFLSSESFFVSTHKDCQTHRSNSPRQPNRPSALLTAADVADIWDGKYTNVQICIVLM